MSAAMSAAVQDRGAREFRLDVVVVNWNGGKLLHECIASLRAAAGDAPFFHVVVVDNASTDGSADGLDAGAAPCMVIRNAENRGFAAACNQGAAIGNAPYVLLLNPDAAVTREDLERTLDFLDAPAQRAIGVCGVRLLDEHGGVARSCARFPSPGRTWAWMLGLDRVLPERFPPHFMTEWDHASSREVDQVMGAFFLVRRPLWEQLGGLDERFFVYYEEVDFCMRARAHGAATYFFAGASVSHVGCGTTDTIRATRLFYSVRSRILYGFKHFPAPAAWLHLGGALVVEPLARVALSLARRDTRGAREVVAGTRRVWRATPAALRGARASSDARP
jgi:GT2 family glycosyltransferase